MIGTLIVCGVVAGVSGGLLLGALLSSRMTFGEKVIALALGLLATSSVFLEGNIIGRGYPTDTSMQISGKDYEVLSHLEHNDKHYLVTKLVESDDVPRLVLVSNPVSSDTKVVRFNETIKNSVVEKK